MAEIPELGRNAGTANRSTELCRSANIKKEEVRVVLGFSDQLSVQQHHLLCSNHCPLNNLTHLPKLDTTQM